MVGKRGFHIKARASLGMQRGIVAASEQQVQSSEDWAGAGSGLDTGTVGRSACSGSGTLPETGLA